METIVALIAFAVLVAAWAILPVRKTHEASTVASVDRQVEIEVDEKARRLVAAAGSVAR